MSKGVPEMADCLGRMMGIELQAADVHDAPGQIAPEIAYIGVIAGESLEDFDGPLPGATRLGRMAGLALHGTYGDVELRQVTPGLRHGWAGGG